MVKFKTVPLVFFCSISLYIWAQSFVIKKPKKVSTRVLKQDIGHLLGDVLQSSALQIKKMAHMQEGIIEKTQELLENESDSFFSQADRTKLQKYHDVLEDFLKKMHDFSNKQQDFTDELLSLYNPCKVV